jgi:2-alkyl-3-oxoalkanoate reductase
MTGVYVVTGGSGFVGKALCLRLLQSGAQVRSISRRDVPELRSAGAQVHRLDLTSDHDQLSQVLKGADVVFHTAAHVKMWGRYDDFFRSNVLATRALLDASRRCGVSRFVYTSSPSVIANGGDLRGVDETIPYPARHMAWYPETKAIAEREVRAAHGSDLRTVALRPHLIFGPGDTNLIPTILDRARAGRLIRIGKRETLSDFTFIDDCVSAHINASAALDASPHCGGRAFFVSQGEPTPLWAFINRALSLAGMPPVSRSIPIGIAKGVASLLEGVCTILPGAPEPPLTRFLVCEMSTDHYFNIESTRKALGFTPSVTVEEGLRRTFKEDGRLSKTEVGTSMRAAVSA